MRDGRTKRSDRHRRSEGPMQFHAVTLRPAGSLPQPMGRRAAGMAGIGTLPCLAAALSRIARGACARYRHPLHDPSIGDGTRARQGEAGIPRSRG